MAAQTNKQKSSGGGQNWEKVEETQENYRMGL